MISLNKLSNDNKPIPILHKCNPERIGQEMKEQETPDFGLDLLIVYLYQQRGTLISANGNLGTDYPHLVARNPKNELLYIWIKTEIAPKVPRYIPGDNHEDIVNIALQNNTIQVFSGIILTCASTEEKNIPVCGGSYFADFTGLWNFLSSARIFEA
jgi:hypothetical protein